MGHQAFFETSVKSLDEAVGFRVVRCCLEILDSPGAEKLLPNRGSELRSSVGCNRLGNAKHGDPPVQESVDYTLGGHVLYWYGRRPSSKTVYYREKVFKTV